jgi:hypothetical protein
MTGTLTPFKDPKYIPVEMALEQLKAYNPRQIPTTATPQPKPQFYVVEHPETYELHNVPYNNGLYKVFLWKKLRNHDETHTQDEWLGIPTMHKIMSAKLLYTLLRESYNSLDDQVIPKMMDEIFRPDLITNHPCLSTRIEYRRSGDDIVTNDLLSYHQSVAVTRIPRRICNIDEASGLEDVISAIFGTRDLQEAKNILTWCGEIQHPTLIGRTHSVDNTNVRAVNVRVFNDKLLIDCDSSINDRRPARAMTMEMDI